MKAGIHVIASRRWRERGGHARREKAGVWPMPEPPAPVFFLFTMEAEGSGGSGAIPRRASWWRVRVVECGRASRAPIGGKPLAPLPPLLLQLFIPSTCPLLLLPLYTASRYTVHARQRPSPSTFSIAAPRLLLSIRPRTSHPLLSSTPPRCDNPSISLARTTQQPPILLTEPSPTLFKTVHAGNPTAMAMMSSKRNSNSSNNYASAPRPMPAASSSVSHNAAPAKASLVASCYSTVPYSTEVQGFHYCTTGAEGMCCLHNGYFCCGMLTALFRCRGTVAFLRSLQDTLQVLRAPRVAIRSRRGALRHREPSQRSVRDFFVGT